MRLHRGVPMLAALAMAVAFVGQLTLIFAASASAQTPFQASVTFTGQLPKGPCANGAFFCGTGNIAGYGPASWNLYVIGSTNELTPCGSTYTATTDFTLANDPDSTLVLSEGGNLCGLGNEGAAYRGYFAGGPNDFGHPYQVVGTWTTQTDCSNIPPPGASPCSTGQFRGLSGSGTDTLQVAGARTAGSYDGTLG